MAGNQNALKLGLHHYIHDLPHAPPKMFVYSSLWGGANDLYAWTVVLDAAIQID